MNVIDTLLGKIEGAKDLDFGIIFSDSIELFKKTWLQGFLMVLFTMLIMLPLIIVFYIPLIGMVLAQQENGYVDTNGMEGFFEGMSALYILFVVVAVLVLGSVTFAINAGFYRIMRKIDNNEQVLTPDFFYFVKKQYLGKTFMIMLATIGIAIPSALLCYIPLIYTMVPLSFFVAIFAFNPDLTVGEIIKVSFKLGHKKWLISFGLIIVSALLANLVGYLLCGIGLLFTSAFTYHPIYLIYKNVIGFDKHSAIDEIGTTTIE
ncbi:MAG: hypothetical protein ABJM36_12965 [Algibacter sp.]|uniref:hypothetical protein n=1 Tax=Algibacter sp. TaxID=1872428 RepID=UPI003299EF2D